ncbi:response regulator transcription factor [Halomonas sp. NyZ770]|uniref:response regulator transcription factor n=1 Tax=Halomonas sp. NyZ770 TaxID=2883106 RepID=UPI000BC3441F|nr:response regulator transcription factor [Halomonas sp. NyZ770]ATH77652.1 DNA-binding response regulator [Halomonas hydrothermalis]UDM06755.1 response regulator transcription factor [Halomonas sp. NyZ770]
MRILVVEDETHLAEQMRTALEGSGFVVDVVGDGNEAVYMGNQESYDAAVLDLGLPGRDGLSVLHDWRHHGRTLPVVILTARDGWSEKVQGFRAGADDYVTKPFRMEEIIMRLRALIRRASGHADVVLRCGELEYDSQLGVFSLSGLPLKLTAFETQLLVYLIHHAEKVVSRTELSEHLYSYDSDRDYNSLEVIISRLRRKVGAGRIETLRGQGYRLCRQP